MAQSCSTVLTKKDLLSAWQRQPGCRAEAGRDAHSCNSITTGNGVLPPHLPTLHASWGGRKDAKPPLLHHHPSPDIVPAPPQDTQTGRRDGERQAAETGSEVTSPAESRLQLQYK